MLETDETTSPEPQKPLAPGIYIVATPIGNLGDITQRSIDVLMRCDGIACEDTRITAKLLRHLGINKPLWRYNDHSGDADRNRLLERAQDSIVALVTDAGTPLISDPGYRLARDARSAGIMVTGLPGASAPILALTLSGLPSDRFLFAGFLPTKEKARRETLEELGAIRSTLIFFEAPPRLTKSLDAIAEIFPQREICVGRELTKYYEEVRNGTAAELSAYYTENPPRGEIVLLIGPPDDSEQEDVDADALLREALLTMKVSQAAGHVSKATGLDRKDLYQRAMELRAE